MGVTVFVAVQITSYLLLTFLRRRISKHLTIDNISRLAKAWLKCALNLAMSCLGLTMHHW